jgi:hypothetical protein
VILGCAPQQTRVRASAPLPIIERLFYDAAVTLDSPYTRWTGDKNHGRTPALAPAWVSLDVLFPQHPEDPVTVVPDGLDLTGPARALRSGWFRSATGQWLAVANYSLGYADGRPHRIVVHDQLIPRRAIRPREDGRSL